MTRQFDFQPLSAITELGEAFYDPVAPADFPETTVRFRNQRWADAIGLGGLNEDDWVRRFACFEPFEGSLPEPLALRYHGHQFGNYNPDIGDGRGFLYAQLRDVDGRLLDFGTKGSGQTPYSRFGDGRLTLKGGVREVLATEMLEALGVYTSKTFSLIETGEALQRNDEPSPTRSAVMVRLQHSHIRFGAFQRHAYHDLPQNIDALVDHCVTYYHPEARQESSSKMAAAFFECVVRATAAMTASWMAAGFVHGVMNTDNMNVTGETFDFGPYRFLPLSDPNFVAAYFDQDGRYRFGRQPTAALWNLQQLGNVLTLVSDADDLTEGLKSFEQHYQTALRNKAFAMLGLTPTDLADDLQALSALYAWMTDTGVSWPQVHFDWFCGEASATRALDGPLKGRYAEDKFAPVRSGLFSRDPVRAERLAHSYFNAPKPTTLLIDDIETLWSQIADRDDWSGFNQKLEDIREARAGLDLTPSPSV